MASREGIAIREVSNSLQPPTWDFERHDRPLSLADHGRRYRGPEPENPNKPRHRRDYGPASRQSLPPRESSFERNLQRYNNPIERGSMRFYPRSGVEVECAKFESRRKDNLKGSASWDKGVHLEYNKGCHASAIETTYPLHAMDRNRDDRLLIHDGGFGGRRARSTESNMSHERGQNPLHDRQERDSLPR